MNFSNCASFRSLYNKGTRHLDPIRNLLVTRGRGRGRGGEIRQFLKR